MAYNALAQGDHEIASESGASSRSASPLPQDAHFDPLPPELENLGGSQNLENADTSERSAVSRLNSLMKSMASNRTSYDLVEDDDYREEVRSPSPDIQNMSPDQKTPTKSDKPPTPPPHALSHPVPLRSASISQSLPLRHPTPDLQSIQGAYVENVKRLEESAERLSMSSSVEEELQKIKSEQRRPARQYSAPVGISQPQPGLSRQFSASSYGNSIIDFNQAARAGYNPGSYITSPHGSIHSNSWHQHSIRSRNASQSSRLSTLPEPQKEGRPLDSPMVSNFPTHSGSEDVLHFDEPTQMSPEGPVTSAMEAAIPERPPTSASNDTYRQAAELFEDFDGVHYYPGPSRQASVNRQVSIDRPPLASEPQPHEEPGPGENMIFYPAPVPMMLNLPQKLSQMPTAAERERRRLIGISHVPNEARKSAAWLQGPGADTIDKRKTKALSTLPPQLRASAFFDQPAAGQEVTLKDSSAVATLDSILDAAAYAPVSAFTDHPIVGRAGAKNIYTRQKVENRKSSANLIVPQVEARKSRRLSSFSNLLKANRSSEMLEQASGEPAQRKSSGGRVASRESRAQLDDEAEDVPGRARGSSIRDRSMEMERAAEESLLPSDDELDEEGSQDSQKGADVEEDDDNNDSAPTTLLAELQRRKQQQKQRNRTVVPTGTHHTLLELDAIAQIQKKSRKQKHITLAWEDQEEADKENFDDEDVPLGVLFPGKENATSRREMGLMEKREAEESEPLSHRRARLRGELPPNPRNSVAPSRLGMSFANNRSSAMLSTMQRSPVREKFDDGETLGQRARRLKAQKEAESAVKTPITGDFASDVLSGLKVEDSPAMSAKAKGKQKATEPPAEETLGQRRKRLQAEAARKASGGSNTQAEAVNTRPSLANRHSLANILTAHPAGGPRKVSDEKRNTIVGAAPQQFSSRTVPTLNALESSGGIRQNSMPMWNANGTVNGAVGGGFQFPAMAQSTAFPNGMQAYGTMPWHYLPNNRTQYVRDIDVMGNMGNGPPLDTKQRAQIERWRSSIVH
ncbi:MAG: hypothetical protein Q9227_000969 [Pyrenula ochraceoflavens]